jgi:hypothetical protein
VESDFDESVSSDSEVTSMKKMWEQLTSVMWDEAEIKFGPDHSTLVVCDGVLTFIGDLSRLRIQEAPCVNKGYTPIANFSDPTVGSRD